MKAVVCILPVILLMLSFAVWGQTHAPLPGDPLVEVTSTGGQIDWRQGIVTVIGMGVLPENIPSPARARLLARRIAQVDAYRQLAETIAGVRVTATTIVRNYELLDDRIRTVVNAFIRGQRAVKEEWQPDGTVEITMVAPLRGRGGLAPNLLPLLRERNLLDLPEAQVPPEPPRLKATPLRPPTPPTTAAPVTPAEKPPPAPPAQPAPPTTERPTAVSSQPPTPPQKPEGPPAAPPVRPSPERGPQRPTGAGPARPTATRPPTPSAPAVTPALRGREASVVARPSGYLALGPLGPLSGGTKRALATTPRVTPLPAPSPTAPPGLPPLNIRSEPPYTGLIVDARGLGLRPAMAPKIRNANEEIVFGYVKAGALGEDLRQYVLEKGIVAYARYGDPLAETRAGNSPLIVRALGVYGRFKGDVILSQEDAERVLKANARDHFLDEFKVVFLLG